MTTLGTSLAAQESRRSIARMGAYAQHAKHDPHETTRNAFEARMRRYRAEADPTGELATRNPQELARRVEAALRRDMERVRYAKAQRRADREKLTAMVRRTPSDDLPMLGAEVMALELNAQAIDRITVEEQLLRNGAAAQKSANADKTEAASTPMDAAPAPQSQRKQAKSFSSDGGTESIAPTPRRRQTSSPQRSASKNA